MPANSQEKVVLITGAAKRIGAAIACRLANDGWCIALHCHRSHLEAESLMRELTSLGVKCTALSADLADEAQVKELISAAASVLGPVTALVNNASLFEYDKIAGFSASTAQRHYMVNTIAPAILARDLHAQLPETVQGCVVNLLDQKLWNPNPDNISYTLSKAALKASVELLAQALAPKVRVVGLAPGLTLNLPGQPEEVFEKMHASYSLLEKSSQLNDITEAVSYLLNAKSVTATNLIVDGGQHLIKMQRDFWHLEKSLELRG